MTAILSTIALPSFGQEFVYETFESLTGPDEAYAQVEPVADNMIPRLRGLFLKHQVEEFAGLSLLHRHFDLNAGVLMWDAAAGKRIEEAGQNLVMVETFVDGASITKPAVWTDDLVPHTWKLALSSDGKTVVPVPIEFIRADDQTPDFKSQALKVSEENLQPFLQELFALLKDAGLESLLGVNLAHRRDSLRTKDIFLLREESVDGASVVKPLGPEHDVRRSIPTSWIFDTNEPEAKADACCDERTRKHEKH